jgi:predicted  nucleic acid-binding Zn-ribbon protein
MGEANELKNGLESKALQEVIEDRNRLRNEVTELQRALEEARQELRDKAAIAAERDQYLQELERFWGEAIEDMNKNGVDLGEVIAEIERDMTAVGQLDAK